MNSAEAKEAAEKPLTRRQAREWALQMLVQAELNPPADLDEALSAFWEQLLDVEKAALAEDAYGATAVFTREEPGIVSTRARLCRFAEARVRGVLAERDALDKALEPYLEHWSLYRLGTVERNALRIGAWEILHCADIPFQISVSEAVDLTKYFSTSASGRFVNGVLDRFGKQNIREGGVFTP